MNHLKQQTFLVLEGSSEVAHQKIKVVLVKFKENVTPEKVQDYFQIRSSGMLIEKERSDVPKC